LSELFDDQWNKFVFVPQLKRAGWLAIRYHRQEKSRKNRKEEFRTVANVTEKLICERLRDLGFLDTEFNPAEGEPLGNKAS
jgi:hypothetical protein